MLIFTAVNDFIDFFLLSIFCFCISYLFFFFLLEPCNKKNILITSTKLDLCPLIHLSLIFFIIVSRTTGTHAETPTWREWQGRFSLHCMLKVPCHFHNLFLKQSTVTWCEVNKARHIQSVVDCIYHNVADYTNPNTYVWTSFHRLQLLDLRNLD